MNNWTFFAAFPHLFASISNSFWTINFFHFIERPTAKSVESESKGSYRNFFGERSSNKSRNQSCAVVYCRQLKWLSKFTVSCPIWPLRNPFYFKLDSLALTASNICNKFNRSFARGDIDAEFQYFSCRTFDSVIIHTSHWMRTKLLTSR